jgi:hypothetical protein
MNYESAVTQSAFQRATVIATDPDGSVRLGLEDGSTAPAEVLDARAFGIGDRVLAAETDGSVVVVGRLGAGAAEEISAGGVRARTEPGPAGAGTLRVMDSDGRELLTHDAETGVTTVTLREDNRLRVATSKTLELTGAEGVRITSGGPVAIDSAAFASVRSKDASLLLGGSSAVLKAESASVRVASLDVRADESRVDSARLAVSGEAADVRFDRAEGTFGTVRSTAERVLRSVAGLCQTIAGRARMVVSDSWQVEADRTRLASKRDTSIDGEHIHLG